MDSDIAGGFAEAVHDAAQRGFMNPQHARQTILPDASGVHPQLEVRVNVSIQAHVIALGFYGVAASCGETGMTVTVNHIAITVPKLDSLFVNILLLEDARKISQKYQTSGSIQRYEDFHPQICN